MARTKGWGPHKSWPRPQGVAPNPCQRTWQGGWSQTVDHSAHNGWGDESNKHTKRESVSVSAVAPGLSLVLLVFCPDNTIHTPPRGARCGLWSLPSALPALTCKVIYVNVAAVAITGATAACPANCSHAVGNTACSRVCWPLVTHLSGRLSCT